MGEIEFVVKRSGAIVPFKRERISNAIYRAAVAVGGRDKKIAEDLSNQVVNLLEENTLPGQNPTIEDIQDAVEKILIENGHAKVAKAYILYRDERARKRAERAVLASHPSQNIPWSKIWRVLDWAVSHNLHTIDALNRRIKEGEFKNIVAESESAYELDVEYATELIASRRDNLKVVIISGPSSSGKTTTTFKLRQRLGRMGLKLVTLNVDNYFYDLELHPKDEFGDYDFETPQALDLALINEHLVGLIEGKEVLIPFYDFKTGHRYNERTPLKLSNDEILLIDSLHGLFPDMTQAVGDEYKFKLYIEPLLQMKDKNGNYVQWTDLRLIRRMLRDSAHRAYNSQMTLEHWHYVRSSEMRNIIPHITQTDFIVNSGMPYELPIYRARLFDQFITWVDELEGNALKVDAYMRASRVAAVLDSVLPVEDDSCVPPDSVLREFIGGSCYDY